MERAKIYQINEGVYKYLVFFRRKGWKDYRRRHRNKEDALKDCDGFNETLIREGLEGVHIGVVERNNILICRRLLEGTGLNIVQAVELGIKAHEGRASKEPIQSVIDEFLDKKERQGREILTIKDCKIRLGAFVRYVNAKTIADFNSGNIEEFVYSGRSNTTKLNNYKILNNFATWCIRRKLLKSNPLLEFEKPSAKRSDTVQTFTVDETREFLEHLACSAELMDCVPFYAVLLFAFLRPSEADALQSSDFQAGKIRVAGGKMRGRKRRLAPIPENLQSILAGRTWSIPSERKQKRCRKVAPFWVVDVCRHTGISFALALHGEQETARRAGNSADTIFRYYHEPKTRAEAEAFFSIKV